MQIESPVTGIPEYQLPQPECVNSTGLISVSLLGKNLLSKSIIKKQGQ